jgi:hypothetical protein
LVGDNKPYSQITKSFSVGDVNGLITGGGLAGANAGNIIQSYSSANVVSTDCAGGLVGMNDSFEEYSSCVSGSGVIIIIIGGSPPAGNITNSYSTGSVNVIGIHSTAGGLCGENCYGIIEKCYSTGSVTSPEECYTGGLCGKASCLLLIVPKYGGGYNYDANSYFLTTAGPDNGYGVPMTSEEMKEQANYLNWDFSYADGNDAVWYMAEDGYPILPWQISPVDIFTDGKNNFRDFAVLARFWMRDDCRRYNDYCDWADLNFDGSVDIDDLVIFMTYWLKSGIYE